ncbi:hypothetical protein Fcan01_16379 [Folsomia candida]|uniref:Uncharacterized protein n=1 Tax=Folsomia candida TaxID=158441 RepID=A0A226DT12_FOLCA|nr:hypothetical protein Fcan01_16379 [Folsomia candida]
MLIEDINLIKRNLKRGISFSRLFTTFAYLSSFTDKAKAAIGAAIYLTGFIVRLDLPIDYVAVNLVNFLICHPNDVFGLTKPSKLQLCIRFLYWCAEVTSLLISVTIATLSLLSPCQPVLLTSLLCSGGNICGWKDQNTLNIALLSLAALEFIAFGQLTTGMIHYIGSVMLHGVAFLWLSSQAIKWHENIKFKSPVPRPDGLGRDYPVPWESLEPVVNFMTLCRARRCGLYATEVG